MRIFMKHGFMKQNTSLKNKISWNTVHENLLLHETKMHNYSPSGIEPQQWLLPVFEKLDLQLIPNFLSIRQK